jgi:hypothetical protein
VKSEVFGAKMHLITAALLLVLLYVLACAHGWGWVALYTSAWVLDGVVRGAREWQANEARIEQELALLAAALANSAPPRVDAPILPALLLSGGSSLATESRFDTIPSSPSRNWEMAATASAACAPGTMPTRRGRWRRRPRRRARPARRRRAGRRRAG